MHEISVVFMVVKKDSNKKQHNHGSFIVEIIISYIENR